MKAGTRRKLVFLAGFTVYFSVLWLLWYTPVIYPLKIFVVLLHEISHGLMAVATGGSIQRIVLDVRQGGACYCPGGNAFLTLSAGYLGSLGFGALILTAGQRAGRWTRSVTGWIGFLVLALTLLYVRGLFGFAFGVLFAAGLLLSAKWLSVGVNRVLLVALGLTSCLYAVLDIKSDILDRPHLPSDAHMLAQLTGVPTVAWGVLWIGIALAVSGWLFLRAWRNA
jgi:hypothetical protein